ncbi:MAG: hypothetical protein JST49_02490 [Bacteroidetes bacterium]|nr:hypothetical protein [Bacteroidota bacterium]
MKYMVLLLGMLLLHVQAWACLSAHQNRMFPIGMYSQGLVVLEVHLQRDDSGGEEGADTDNPTWFAQLYCNTYSNYALQNSDTLGSIEYKESELIEQLQPYLQECQELYAQLPGFVPVGAGSITFYAYNKGAGIQVVADTLKRTACIKVHNKLQVPLPLYATNFPLYEDYQRYLDEVEDTAAYIMGLEEGLLVGSARTYVLGKQKLYVIHLESGQLYPDPAYEAKVHAAESKNFTETGLYTEPVLHHGNGFDFYVLE